MSQENRFGPVPPPPVFPYPGPFGSARTRTYPSSSLREIRFSATSPSSTSSHAATMVPGSFLAARPTWSTRSSRPGTTLKPLRQVSERSSMESLSAPPSSNQWTMSSTLAPPTRDSNVFPAARRFRSLQLALVLELELARDRRQCGVDVRDTGDHRLFLGGDAASLGVGDHVLQYADRQPLRNARAAVHPLVLTRLEGDALDQLRHEVG